MNRPVPCTLALAALLSVAHGEGRADTPPSAHPAAAAGPGAGAPDANPRVPSPVAPAEVPSCALASVLVTVDGSTGSGTVIDPRGYVLTNFHVVAPVLAEGFDGPRVRGGHHARIQVPDRQSLVASATHEVELVATSRTLDLAVLRVVTPPSTPFVSMALAPTGVAQTGDTVTVLGYPFGHPTLTVLRGAVTSHRERGEAIEWLTIDAPFNPGNSGGSVVDAACRLVAVPTQVFRGGISPVSMARPLDPRVRTFVSEAVVRASASSSPPTPPAFDRDRPTPPKARTPGAPARRGGRR